MKGAKTNMANDTEGRKDTENDLIRHTDSGREFEVICGGESKIYVRDMKTSDETIIDTRLIWSGKYTRV